ncbi:hypothetical protein Patl1_15002 [Pistacia atlantica]|uniref:Uncharacterized protein n=1 Tax=Pistacia atlantica TaxID=434234 RepID=A0ACC1B7F1_9ROSI|nr:hypothetical protein Patl1_15002 [Pistacia atlantica]
MVNLATRYFPSEIINSNKVQVYKGLDITTNKNSLLEHHITTNKNSLLEHQNILHHFLVKFQEVFQGVHGEES